MKSGVSADNFGDAMKAIQNNIEGGANFFCIALPDRPGTYLRDGYNGAIGSQESISKFSEANVMRDKMFANKESTFEDRQKISEKVADLYKEASEGLTASIVYSETGDFQYAKVF